MSKKKLLSSASEDYLVAIYRLRAVDEGVTTTRLAEAMHVSAASATNMIKKLAALKLVRHSPYYGVQLTPAGEKFALEILRHHRLVELFLHEALGVPWDEVHEEAHKLEHVLSDSLEDHIANFLGHPTEDPHGDPIPTKAGVLDETFHTSLADVAIGQSAVIRRVTDQDPEHLRHLANLGLVPNARVQVLEREPFGGPLRVRVEQGKEHSLALGLASQLWVRIAPAGTRKYGVKSKKTEQL